MAVGWGVDAILENGVPSSGTSSKDVQRIWGALYSPGIIAGVTVTTSSTGMFYTVNAGAVVVETMSLPRQCVMVPIEKTTLNVSATAGTAARVDTIYVQQDLPGLSNLATVRVAQGVAPPSDVPTLVIARMSVPANSSNTSGAVRQATYPYSVPYGANLGHFYAHIDTSTALLPTTPTTVASGAFNLPVDRKIQVSLTACLSAMRSNGTTEAVGFDNAAYCEAKYDVYVDGIKKWTWNTPGLSQAYSDLAFEEYLNLTNGPHTISYRAYSRGPGRPKRRYSGTDLSTGTSFVIRDAGFWEPFDAAV